MMLGNVYTVNSSERLKFFHQYVDQLWEKHKYLEFQVNKHKSRTSQQNRAIHLYCRMLAKSLNESGQWLVMELAGKKTKVPWSDTTVKELIWRPIQKALTGKKSSTKLDVSEVSEIYETINLHTAEKLGVSVLFPSEDLL